MITLIGTIHTDLKLEERLPKMLSIEKPDIITLEYDDNESLSRIVKDNSKLGLKLIKEGLKDKINEKYFDAIINFIKKNLEVNEYTICQDYVNKNNLPLYFVDKYEEMNPFWMNRIVLQILNNLDTIINTSIKIEEGGIDPINLLGYFEQRIEEKYTEYKKAYINNSSYQTKYVTSNLSKGGNIKNILERDNHMASEIRKIYTPNLKLVHIVGLYHLLNDSKKRTLYSRLKDLNPKRRLLNEV